MVVRVIEEWEFSLGLFLSSVFSFLVIPLLVVIAGMTHSVSI